ncbi:MAG: hypothetical protein DRJ50_15120, partial [Actinobacteria bacterium]
REKEMSSLLFDREYRTLPRSSTSSLFPYERIEPLLKPSMECVSHYRKPEGLTDRFAVVSGWDIAWSERTGGDYLAKVTALLDRFTMRKRILDVNRWRGLSFLEQLELIRGEYERYGDDAVVIEDEGAQRIWIQVLGGGNEAGSIAGMNPFATAPDDALDRLDLGGVPAVPHSMSKKQSFESGVPGMLLDIEAGRWEIPFKRGRNFAVVQAFLSELEAYGWHDDKLEGVGEHDDLVTAWYHCWWGLEQLRRPGGERSRERRVPRKGVS